MSLAVWKWEYDGNDPNKHELGLDAPNREYGSGLAPKQVAVRARYEGRLRSLLELLGICHVRSCNK